MKKKFFKDRGFYIALCACIAVMGAVAYIGNRSEKQPLEQKTIDSVEIAESTALPMSENTLSPSPASTFSAATPIPKSTSAPSAKTTSKSVEVTDSTPSAVPTTAAEMSFQMPLTGKVILTFSDGALVYNKDLDDWRSHDGIDIQADVGTDVKAVADGSVKTVSSTPLGKTVTIEHDNAYTSIYANLDENVNVKADQKVKAGDTIGKVGKTSVAEQFMDSHLHFELLQDGKYKNPLDFVK